MSREQWFYRRECSRHVAPSRLAIESCLLGSFALSNYDVRLHRNAGSALNYFSLPADRVVIVGVPVDL